MITRHIQDFCAYGEDYKQKVDEYETYLDKLYAIDDNIHCQRGTLILTNCKNVLEMAYSAPEFYVCKQDFARGEKYFKHLGNGITLFHGPGGCGKTFTLNKMIDYMRYEKIKVAVTASTGIAAMTFTSATTIHSWSGIGIRTEIDFDKKRPINTNAKRNIRWVEYLIIDEISMISAEFFDLLNQVCQFARGNQLPFGGIKLVLSGDFKQLRPVSGKMIHTSRHWKDVKIIKFLRPKRFDDIKYFEFLLRVRLGKITDTDIDELEKRVININDSQSVNENGIIPTILFSRNKDVNFYNSQKLDKLKTESATFEAIDCFSKDLNERLREGLTKNLNIICPKILTLKVNAQVIVRKNISIENGLCNGSRGVIVSVNPVIIRLLSGKEHVLEPHEFKYEYNGHEYSRIQLPLILGWAVTIHKSQGSTIDRAICALDGKIFDYAQIYVALSRVRNWNSLFISSFDRKIFV